MAGQKELSENCHISVLSCFQLVSHSCGTELFLLIPPQFHPSIFNFTSGTMTNASYTPSDSQFKKSRNMPYFSLHNSNTISTSPLAFNFLDPLGCNIGWEETHSDVWMWSWTFGFLMDFASSVHPCKAMATSTLKIKPSSRLFDTTYADLFWLCSLIFWIFIWRLWL